MEKKPIKILAIDDNPDNLVVLKALLSERFSNVKFLGATSGEKGIELCLTENPDVILLDIVMPIVDGYEVCRRIKSNERSNFIPVIMITASRRDTESRIKALESGADAFLAKPIDESELTAQIRAMLLIKEAGDQKRNEKERLHALVEEKTKELTDELKKRIEAENQLQKSFYKLEESRQSELRLLENLQAEVVERKRAEEELVRFFNLVPDLVCIVSDGKFKKINKAWEDTLGFSEQEILNKPLLDQIHPEDRESTIHEINRQLAGFATFNFVNRYICKDGNYKSLEWMATPAVEGSLLFAAARDVTERLRAETALSQSRKEFQNYFENSATGMAVSSVDKKWIKVNQKLCQMLGYTKDELIGMKWEDISYPEDLEQNLDLFQQAVNGKIDKYEMDKRFIRKDGSVLYITLSVVCERNEDSTLHHLLSSSIDITERKIAEKSLKESEERFHLLFNKAPLGYQSLDFEGNFIEINQQWLDTLGYSREEVIGKWFGNFLSPEYCDGFRKRFPLFKAKGSIHSEFEMVHKNGNRLFIAFEGKIGYDSDGEFKQTHCILQDITESKKIAEALRESENRFRSLYENAPIGIYRTTPEGKILLANPVLVKLFGKKSSKEMENWNLTVPEDFVLKYSRKEFEEKLARDGKVKGLESKLIREDGSAVFIRESAVLVRDNIGSPLYYDGTIEDITDQKLAEEALLESESRYRLLFDNSMDAVLLTGPDGTILEANATACKIFRRTEEELKLVGHTAVIDTTDPRLAIALKSRALNGKYEGELTGLRYDGTKFPIEIASALFHDRNGNSRSSMIIRDVTERKLAEENLRESEELLSMHMKHSPIYSYIKEVDPKESRVLKASENFKNIIGFSGGEIIGKTMTELFPADFAAKITADDWEVVSSCKIREIEEELNERFYTTIKYPINLGNRNLLAGHSIDITEYKKTNKALVESRQMLEVIIDTIPARVFWKDKNLNYLGCNTFFAQDAGFMKPEDIIGKNDYAMSWSDQAELYHADDLLVIGSRKPKLAFEEFQITHSGDKIWCLKSKIPLKNASGEVEALLGVYIDITERKKAEVALMEAFQFNKQVIETSHEGIIVYGRDMKYQVWNPFMENITGISASELLGMYPLDVFPFLKDAGVIDIIKRAMKGEVCPAVEFQYYIPANGKKGWASDTSGPLRNAKGEIIGVISTVFDITESRLAEEKMKSINERFELAVATAGISVWERDIATEIIKIDDNFNRIYGNILGNYQIRFSDFMKFVHPDDLDKIRINYERAKESNENTNYEFRIIRPNGDIRFIQSYIKIVKDKSGNPVKVIGINMDISESKMAAQEIKRAKERAEESDRLKSAFLANMSHEIRTPMNGILGFAALLKEAKLSGKMQKDYIDMIEKSGTRMLNIIGDIMSISKVEAGQMDVNLSETNVNEQIEYIVKFFNPEADKKGLKLLSKIGLPDEKALLNTDKDKLIAILSNLVKNALKFTECGFIQTGYKLKGKYLEFFVKDTGIGFSIEHKEIIFERFRQIGETLSRNYEGAGLGLSIAKAYVEMLGGQIRAESQPGKGSEFYFTLPCKIKSNEKAGIVNNVPGEVTESKVKNLKILIAEDDKISERLLTLAVKCFSSEILTVKNGLDAVETCRNHPDIDLVLMDIQMPVMDGHEATRQIKQFNNKVIIIAQTAYALANDKIKAIEAGCDDYMSKPIDKVLLHVLINKYFRNRVS